MNPDWRWRRRTGLTATLILVTVLVSAAIARGEASSRKHLDGTLPATGPGQRAGARPDRVVKFRRWRERRFDSAKPGASNTSQRQAKPQNESKPGSGGGKEKEQAKELVEDVDPLNPDPESAAASTMRTLVNALSAALVFFLVAPGTFPAAAILVGVFYKLWNFVRGTGQISTGGDADDVDGGSYASVPSSAYEAGKHSGPVPDIFERDLEASSGTNPVH